MRNGVLCGPPIPPCDPTCSSNAATSSVGLDAVRPRLFFGPGAEFVHHADRAGVVAVELHPGDELGV